jgi:hypothetical protein
MKMLFFLIGLFLICITGCASKPVVVNYAPSSLMEKTGKVLVSDINYLPFEKNIVTVNQIQTTALGSFHMESEIGRFVENALKLEFKFVGINIRAKNASILTGSINKFYYDDLGFNADLSLEISYLLKKDNKECFQKTISSFKSSPKFANPTGIVSEVIKNNIEFLLSEDGFIKCIN